MDFVSTCMEVVMANKYDYSLYIRPKLLRNYYEEGIKINIL